MEAEETTFTSSQNCGSRVSSTTGVWFTGTWERMDVLEEDAYDAFFAFWGFKIFLYEDLQ